MKERLIKLMEYLDLNAASFSSEIGVQRSSISHILSGRNQPSFDFLVKISRKYPQINTEWLLTGAGNIAKQHAGLTGNKPIQQSLFNNDTDSFIKPTEKSENDKKNKPEKRTDQVTNVNYIERVIIFYKNGTFSEYIPSMKD